MHGMTPFLHLCNALSSAARSTAIVVNHNRFIAAWELDFYHTGGYDTSQKINRTGNFLWKHANLALDAVHFPGIAVFIDTGMAAVASATDGD
jgi:hypothetical protein